MGKRTLSEAITASQNIKERDYWLNKLSGELEKSSFPYDRNKSTLNERHTGTLPFRFNREISAKIIRLSNESDVRLFIILAAGLVLLIDKYAYKGSHDIIVGTGIYKQQGDAELINTILALRNRIHANMTFKELLLQVKQTHFQAVEHQNYPFETLLYQLNMPVSADDFPLFEIVVLLENIQDKKYIRHTHPNMLFSFLRSGEDIEGVLEYNAGLYEKTTVKGIINHLENLLHAVLLNVDLQVSAVDILSEEEKRKLLIDFNDTKAGYPADKLIHELFEEAVERTPHNIAVVYEDRRLTYGQLNREANRLAAVLRAKAVTPNWIIALMLDKSTEMIATVLGILKAGGAYLAILPAYPRERVSYMLRESDSKLVLTQKKYKTSNQLEYTQEVIDIGAVGTHPGEDGERNPAKVNKTNDLAYINYTSGSTGHPKGVMIEHGNVVNLLTWFGKNYQLESGMHVLQLTDYTFDPVVEQVFGTLLCNAAVYVAGVGLAADTTLFRQYIEKNRIHMINFVPAVLKQVLCEGKKLESLRVVISGGERLEDPVKDEILQKGYVLYNQYGPTEITVDALAAKCSLEEKVVLGKPIANCYVYILAENNTSMPPGAPGELCVGGPGVSRGYLNKPEETWEKFTANPFKKDERIYRTGDIARYRPNGDIEFLGRTDNQVKIRGHRIETGEIENQLLNHELVEEAVVVAKEDDRNNKYLAAYYVGKHRDLPELWPSVGEYNMYDDFIYYLMTHDELKNKSYGVAVNRSVKDKTVIDVGTGQDAVLARLCAEAGAKKVYAVEILEEFYKKSKETVKKHGLENKITLVHGDIMHVRLPEKVDVCVSEQIGNIGGSGGAAALLNSARRFLKTNGTMIPAKCITKIAAVFLPEMLHENPGFSEISGGYVEKIFAMYKHKFDVKVCIKNYPKSNIISNIEIFEALDFTKPVPLEDQQQMNFVINKDAVMDGFLMWINLHTVENEVIDTLENNHTWLPAYVPVFYPGVEVFAGDVITAQCVRRLNENLINPEYTIKGVLTRKNGKAVEFEYHLPFVDKAYRANPFYRKLFKDNAVNYIDMSSNELDAGELRKYLSEKLPAYMVPSHFMPLTGIPLSANGKIDRKSLPEPGLDAGEKYAAPRSDLEKKLVEIWSDILGIEKDMIGIDTNFFRLGGHSLNATVLIANIHKELNVRLPLVEIFNTPTIRELAQYLKMTEADKFTSIEISEKKEYYPLSSAQKRMFIVQQVETESKSYNIPAVLILEGKIDHEVFERAFTRLLKRHESLRTSFFVLNDEPVQQVHREVSFEIEQLPIHSPYSPEDIIRAFIRPFDLSQAPLLRVGLVKTGETKYLLIVDMHHIIADGVSYSILVKDFVRLYNGSQLPPFKIQYKDFSQWQNNLFGTGKMNDQEKYWLGRFDGDIPFLNLPTDYPRPTVRRIDEGDSIGFPLEQDLVSKMSDMMEKTNTTLFMMLLAVFNIFLAKYTRQEDIVVGSPTAGRGHTDLQDVIGVFINMLAIRNQPMGDKRFFEFLEEVKVNALQAFENQDYQFDDLVIKLGLQGDTARNPLFDTEFAVNKIDTQQQTGEIPGLKIEPYPSGQEFAKFDLHFQVTDMGDNVHFLVRYSTALFKKSTIEKFKKYYIEILEQVLDNIDVKLQNITLSHEFLAVKADIRAKEQGEFEF